MASVLVIAVGANIGVSALKLLVFSLASKVLLMFTSNVSGTELFDLSIINKGAVGFSC